MKVMKWVCRYFFLGLILALCLAWCVYCAVTVGQLRDTVNSLEFIDMAAQLSPETTAVLDRLEQFEGLLRSAILASVIAAVCLGALIVYHAVSHSLRKKAADPARAAVKKAAKPAKKPKSVPAPAAAPRKGGYCTNCGAHYEELPQFCTQCGHKFE